MNTSCRLLWYSRMVWTGHRRQLVRSMRAVFPYCLRQSGPCRCHVPRRNEITGMLNAPYFRELGPETGSAGTRLHTRRVRGDIYARPYVFWKQRYILDHNMFSAEWRVPKVSNHNAAKYHSVKCKRTVTADRLAIIPVIVLKETHTFNLISPLPTITISRSVFP